MTPTEHVLFRRGAEHVVQVHHDPRDLIEAVSAYAVKGLRSRQTVILVGSAAHLGAVAALAAAERIDWAGAQASGQLVVLDAEQTMAKFLVNGAPDWTRFREHVGGIIEQARASGAAKIRIWGEMVNVLWQQRSIPGAVRLEEMWNELGRIYTFTLFCTYLVTMFDDSAEYRDMFSGILQTHSAMLPMERYSRMETAIDAAMEEVLGPSQSGMVRTLIRTNTALPAIPRAQATLLWLQNNMPLVAGRILERAKAVYAAEQPIDR